jgi:AcrR family transcriptional regulator
MTSVYTGAGDPRTTLELLWGVQRRPTRGPRPRLSVEQIAAAAIALADEEGLEALSMRRLAGRLEVTVMSLYTYVPGKAELIDLMLDRVLGDPGPPADGGWRERLEAVARREWQLSLDHPWLLQVSTARPALGPHALAWYEQALHAIDGVGLSEVEMDLIVDLITNYVHGAARSAVAAARIDQQTGVTDDEWWEAVEPVFTEIWPAGRYPIAERVGPVVGERYGARIPPDEAFTFGLARVLDGIAALLTDRTSEPPATSG